MALSNQPEAISARKRTVADVFTPSSIPSITRIPRGDIEDRLATQIANQARPISVEGPYRSGKTTLVVSCVRSMLGTEPVHIVCKRSTTFADIISSAQQRLEEIRKSPANKAPTRASIIERILPFFSRRSKQLIANAGVGLSGGVMSSAALAASFAELNLALVLDDAHKLSERELVSVAEMMREWQTIALKKGHAKMIVIGTTISGIASINFKLCEFAADLSQRLVHFSLPLMTDDELAQIIQNGSNALKVDFSALEDLIIKYSVGHPGICQDLCSLICARAHIREECDVVTKVTITQFQAALRDYVDSHSSGVGMAFSLCREKSAKLDPRVMKLILEEVERPARNPTSDEIGALVASSLGINQGVVKQVLTILTDDEIGVLRLERTTNGLVFKEPIYGVWMKHESAANREELVAVSIVNTLRRLLNSDDD